jgi:hypothetical protein
MPIAYPITLPSSPGTRRVKWSYEFGMGRARSEFTGKSQRYNWPKKLLRVGVEYPPMLRAQAELWLATLRAMDEGQCLFGDPQGQTPRGAVASTPNGIVYSNIGRDFLLWSLATDYVSIPQNAAYNSNDLTVELWFKAPTAAPAATEYLATKWDNASSREFTLHLTTDGKLHWMVRKADNSADVDVASSASYLDGHWYHLAGVKASGGALSLYIDGVLRGSGALGQQGLQNTQVVRAGNNLSASSANAFVGPICELRIWNTARTQLQLQQNLAKQLDGTETGLVGYWKFNNKTGTVVTDLTATANNGTVSGPAWSGLAASELLLAGLPASTAALFDLGDWIQLGSGLTQRIYSTAGSYGLVAPAASNAAGVAHLEIRPGLREIPADQAAVVVTNTQGVFELDQVVVGHEVDVAVMYGIAFNLVEAF